jgi:ankyrin repeat protein
MVKESAFHQFGGKTPWKSEDFSDKISFVFFSPFPKRVGKLAILGKADSFPAIIWHFQRRREIMGFALLWMESQALVLLFIGAIYAVSGRIRTGWRRFVIHVAAFLPPVCLGGAYLLIAVYLRPNSIKPHWLLGYSISWIITFLCGFFFIRRFAIKNKEGLQACGSWPRAVLLGALGIVITFLVTTYLHMDMDARARLASNQIRGLAAAVRVRPAPVPYDENGAGVYQRAFDLAELPNWVSQIEEAGFVPSLRDTEAVLKKNQAALSLLSRAAQVTDISFMPDPAADRFWPSYETKFPPVYGAIKTARLLGLDAFGKIARGETEAAMKHGNALGRMAVLFSRTPYLITNNLSVRLIKVQKAVLERSMAFSPEGKAGWKPASMKTGAFLLESFQRAVIMEEAMFRYSFSKDVSTRPLYALLSMPGTDPLNYIFALFPYRIFMLDSDLEFYDRFWEKTHRFISQPFYQVAEEYRKWEKDMAADPGGIISAIAFNGMSRYALNTVVGEACRRLIQVAVAASAYRWDKGDYPVRIADLVPDYIPQIPIDPFDGQPLKMTTIPEGVTFYSIGPDFKNNGEDPPGGRPDEKRASKDILFRLGTAYDEAYLKPVLSRLAANGSIAMVRRALAVGADVNENVPLVAAATAGHTEIIRLLLEKGADIDAMPPVREKKVGRKRDAGGMAFTKYDRTVGGMNALMAAALSGREQTVELLLKKGANPQKANSKGRTALIVAQGVALLNAGEWMNSELSKMRKAETETKLLEAKVKALKEKTGGIFEKDVDRKGLRVAESRLASARGRIDNWEASKEFAPGTRAKRPGSANMASSVGITQKLLTFGSDIDAKDRFGITALTAAAFSGHVETVRLLIENGAEINSKSRFGWTPLIVAKAHGNHAVEALLVENGASVDEKDQGIINRLAYCLERMKAAPQRKR